MKKGSVHFLMIAAAGLLLGSAGCTGAGSKPAATPAPATSASTISTKTAAESADTTPTTAGIPDRPEKLAFPPLTYEPPDPRQFRVALKSGPVAYVVPDRELPLVNIAVYVRTGEYLEP